MILTLLRSIISTLPEKPTFVVGDKAWQNLVVDGIKKPGVKMPVIFTEDLIKSDDLFRSSMYLDEVFTINMLFLDASRLEWTPEQHEPIYSAMRELRRQFLARLKQHEAIDNTNGDGISAISTQNVKNVMNRNMSGVFLTFRIKPFNDYGFCID